MIEWILLGAGAAGAAWYVRRQRALNAAGGRPALRGAGARTALVAPTGMDIQRLLDQVVARRQQLEDDRSRTLHALARVEGVVAASGPDANTDRLLGHAETELDALEAALAALDARLLTDRIEAFAVYVARDLRAQAPESGRPPASDRFQRAARAVDAAAARLEAGFVPAQIAAALDGTRDGSGDDGAWERVKRWAGPDSLNRAFGGARARLERLRRELADEQRAAVIGDASNALGLGSLGPLNSHDDALIGELIQLDAALGSAGSGRTEASGSLGDAPATSRAQLTLEALSARDRVVG
ncbi:MAG: hypothetical protein IV100_34010 [Myxococcales bacterium]|nr:hypothetical protein [Myxococcales bacterium]